MKELDVLGLQVEPSSNAPFVVLGEQDEPHRLLPLFIGPAEAAAIAIAVSENIPPRPMTHDLLAMVIDTLGATVVCAEISEIRDESFRGYLVVRTSEGDQYIDARPSDAIAVAVRVGAPVFASDEVLEQSGIVPAPPSELAIDAEVDQFRAFLDGIDPDDFGAGSGPSEPGDRFGQED